MSAALAGYVVIEISGHDRYSAFLRPKALRSVAAGEFAGPQANSGYSAGG